MMIFGYLVPMLRLVQIGATAAALVAWPIWLAVHDRKVGKAAVVAHEVRVETEGKKIGEKAHNARASVPVTGNAERVRSPGPNCRDC